MRLRKNSGVAILKNPQKSTLQITLLRSFGAHETQTELEFMRVSRVLQGRLFKLRWPKTGILLPPLVERSIADAQFATDLLYPRTQLVLFDGKRDLLLCKPARLHDMTSFP